MKATIKNSTTKSILILTVISLLMIPIKMYSDDSLPKGALPMISAVEGNVVYYVKAGDKVEKGQPLFFIRSNDFPIEKIKQLKQDIVYFKKTYNRQQKLAKTHSVSIQDLDDAWHGYYNSVNELAIAKQQTKTGFYTAPYDCEIIRCEVPPNSGRGDGDPVLYIKGKPATSAKK